MFSNAIIIFNQQKFKWIASLTSLILTIWVLISASVLTPNTVLAGPAKGCTWVGNVPNTAFNICQEVEFNVQCRKDGGRPAGNQ